jgi:AraC family transcriptional regulator of arabinose operon
MDRRVKRVVEMLDEHLGTPLRVRDLARLVGLGASRLEHLFKEEARISIRDYLRDRRLTAAAAMLESTEERVSVISFQVGFQHVANFNHAFKKRYGISPRRYREQRNTDSIQAE